jgi:calcineurin-like phosphoesterase
MGWYLDGRVSAVVEPTRTCDRRRRVLRRVTAYVSDIGMTVRATSIIGFSLETVRPRFTEHLPTRFHRGRGPGEPERVVVTVAADSGERARSSASSAPSS